MTNSEQVIKYIRKKFKIKKSIGEADKQEVCTKQLRLAEQAVLAAKEQLLRAEDQHNSLCTAAKEHKTAQVVQQVIANLSHKLQRFAKLVRCLKKKVDELENEKNTRLIQDQDASLLLTKLCAAPMTVCTAEQLTLLDQYQNQVKAVPTAADVDGRECPIFQQRLNDFHVSPANIQKVTNEASLGSAQRVGELFADEDIRRLMFAVTAQNLVFKFDNETGIAIRKIECFLRPRDMGGTV